MLSKAKKFQDTLLSQQPVEINPNTTWKNDYDIRFLDMTIRSYLKNNKTKLPEYQKKIRELQTSINPYLSRVQRYEIEENIKKLEKIMSDIEKAPTEYAKKANPLLKEYTSLSKRLEQVGKELGKEFDESEIGKFIGSGFGESLGGAFGHYLGEIIENNQNLIEGRQKIIEEFLEMCQLYYSHNIKREKVNVPDDYCSACITKLIEVDDEILQCPQCATNYEKKRKHVIKSSNAIAEHMKHFEKYYGRHTGEINRDIPPEIIAILEERAENSGYVKNGVWKDLKRIDFVRLIFGCDQTRDYYHDASYLLFVWRGFSLPSYQSSRQEIMNLCQEFAEEFEEINVVEQTSFPNGLYLLFKILELLGEEIQLEELKPSISPPTIDKYDSLWSKFCLNRGYKFIRSR